MTLLESVAPQIADLLAATGAAPSMASDGSLASGNATAGDPQPPARAASDRDFSYYVAYACLYSLGAFYLAPSVISWTRMSRNIHTEDKTAVRLFALLGFGALLRALAFLLVAVWMLFVIRSSGSTHEAQHLHLTYVQLVTAWQGLGMVASLVLVAVFLLIFNTWASMIEQVESSRTPPAYRTSTAPLLASAAQLQSHNSAPPPRILFIRMVLVTNVFQIATFALVNCFPLVEFCQSLHFFATLLLTACFAVCALLLPAYGQRMCALLGKVAEGADRRQRNIRRIAAISAVFCVMRTLSELLLLCSQYSQHATSDVGRSRFEIPLQHIMEANPIFFFSPAEGAGEGLLRWVVLLEVVEFPIEWTLLMTLLCVLPARAVLPSIRGYQAIAEPKRCF